MEAHLTGPVRAAIDRPPLTLTRLSDERLARLAGDDDQRAFAALYKRYHQQLYRYCRSILRHDADAQDALQSTLARAFSALERGQRDAPLRPWLFRIAHNEAVSLLRRRRTALELPQCSEGATKSAEERAEERERLSLLVSDLLELPERQRGALLMRELSGLSHEEIAIALGTSVGAAKQTIFEARRSLFEYAEGREMPCEEIRRMISDADGRALRGRAVRAHLRDCASCAGFAAAIPARRAELRALAPALPAAAATPLLAHMLGRVVSNSGGAASVSAAAGKTAASGLVAKALAGLVVATAATVGVTRALEHATTVSARPAAAASAQRSAVGTPAGRAHPTARRPAAGQRTIGLRRVSRTGAAGSARRPAVGRQSDTRVRGASAGASPFSSAPPNRNYAPGQAGSSPGRANAHAPAGQGSAGSASRSPRRHQAPGLEKGPGGLRKGSGSGEKGSGQAGKTAAR